MAKTIFITGASQGIGKATATRFAEAGYNLVLASRQVDRLQAVAEELRSRFSVQTLAIPTDVKDAQQVDSCVQKALHQFGAIDVLVNNAGIYSSGPVEAFSLEDWHQVLDTNLWGYIHTVHALLPAMLQQRKGAIVNVCSVGGAVPLAYLTAYTTSKFAIDGFTQALHAELAPKGICVSGVYPNIIRSDFLERAIFRGKTEADQQERRQQVEQLVQVPLVETPEDVARAIWDAVQHRQERVFVGSAKASAGIHAVAPQLLRWVIRKTFQHHDH